MVEEKLPASINKLQIFQQDLLHDEKLLWTGQPKASLLNSNDYYLMLPSTAGLIAVLAAAASTTDIKQSDWKEAFPFLLMMIVFLPVLFYLLFGRLLYRSWKNKHTYYAVTDKRILFLHTAPSRSLQAIFINTIPALNKSINLKGEGTIAFGSSHPHVAMYANSGLDFFVSASGLRLAPAFYNVDNANKIYNLIINQRTKLIVG